MRGSRDDITEIGSQPMDALVARAFQVVLGCLQLNNEPNYCLAVSHVPASGCSEVVHCQKCRDANWAAKRLMGDLSQGLQC